MERTAPENLVRSAGLLPGRYFVMVSRVVPEKRQLDLIEAFNRSGISDWTLALVGGLGEDDYSRKVREAAAKSRVVLTGFQSGEALRQLYTHAGAFVLPSSHEGLPIALLEALSFGLPVIASDIPANLEIGLDSSAYFPVGDIPALSERLSCAAAHPATDAARLERMKWVSERYDWDRIAQQTFTLYRAVMAAR